MSLIQKEVQEIANSSNLDVRDIKDNIHYRLLDCWGNNFIDIYFKKNKAKTCIVKNTTFHFRTQKWGEIKTKEELINLIKI